MSVLSPFLVPVLLYRNAIAAVYVVVVVVVVIIIIIIICSLSRLLFSAVFY
jgi:hypothetical protein